ncbi:2Fe-2S iron-sulfur cluster-binding protein, partial [bacterium]|nr:2Fe-2S iron-sulfur cluster-binding protein [bacterium]
MIKNKRLKFGGRVNREQKVNFFFNGKKYTGFQGDTLASALLANGVMVTARSFKYHRPRGIVGAGIEEPASLVELLGDDESGNNLITSVVIKEGLKARSVNCWPSAEFDFGALIQVFSRFIPAGFYYKTFKWPTWHLFEPFIRKAAGLARAPVDPPKEGHFESRNAHADILIVGAGPSGLMAALVAGRAGARVIIADQNCEPGGSLLDQNLEINGQTGLDWVQDVVSELSSMGNVSHLQNSTVWAYREHNLLIINQRTTETASIIERSWRVRANQVLIATGAIERSLVFPNNDRPGVMMASAIQAYINRYAVLPGEKVVLFTNNDSAYSVAVDILNAGGQVVAVVDSRKSIPEYATKKIPNVTVFSDSVVAKVNGYKRVKSVEIMSISTKKIVAMS